MKYVLIAAFAALLLLVLGLLIIPENKQELTSLSFRNHLDLPSTGTYNSLTTKRTPFQFIISNKGDDAQTYSYTITWETNESSIILDSGTRTVNSYGAAVIESRYVVPEPFTRARIVVTLDDRPESIHFWIDAA